MDAVSPRLEEPAEASNFRSIEQPFIGRWNQLVSTTNWEKGRIIHQWREAFLAAGASATEYSDDAWSSRVGGVSGQHIGRLRRVYQRFGSTYERYRGLFWSHFQAAIDWDDAEMWLEGAVQNDWSVMDMRRTRWDTLQTTEGERTAEVEMATADVDEDYVAQSDTEPSAREAYGDDGEMRSPEGPDFGDEAADESYDSHETTAREQVPLMRPFERLAELPPDFADAFESLKLSILRHKSEEWQAISRDDVIGALEALKELAIAPNG